MSPYATAQAAITAANLTGDAAVALANSTVYDWRSRFVSYRTIFNLLITLGVDPATAGTQMASISAAVKAVNPLFDAWLNQPGGDDGSGGGIDISLPLAQAMIAQFQAGGLFTADQADAILDLARSNPRTQYQIWGLSSFDASTLAKLTQYVAWESLVADVDANWLPAIDSSGPVFQSLASIDAGALATRRAAMVTAVQSYRAKIDAGTDVSDMPATAALLSAQVGAA